MSEQCKFLPDFLNAFEYRCDEIQLDGKLKPSNVSQSGYQHAQKMCASMTHIFGHNFELGSTPWVKDRQTGRTFGNPSVSEKVATYMVSLHNKKVRFNIYQCLFHLFDNWCMNNRPEPARFQQVHEQ